LNIRKVLDPKPDENLELGETVAVVGNSGLLSRSGCGEDIDGHDVVIRFNAAPVAGFEEDVGSTTTFRVLNAITQKGSTCNGTDQIGLERLQQLFAGERLACKRSSKDVYRMACDNYSEHAEWVSKINRKGYYIANRRIGRVLSDKKVRSGRLSLGVFLAVLMSKFCETVNLYGFGFHREKLDNIHYWEGVEKDITAHHDYSLEKRIIDVMERKGMLRRIRHE